MKQKEFSINPTLNQVRKDYDKSVLLEENCEKSPFDQFENWLTEALEKDPMYANAMTLSTVAPEGMPDSRIVLLRNISYGGFTFFTNYRSAKGQQIDKNPKASLLFFWKDLERQVKIQGELRFLPVAESDAYFKSRPFESQVGAWASKQSHVIKDRTDLDKLYDDELAKHKGLQVPRPEYWGGYVLLPAAFEFWQGRKSRLHDRIVYRAQTEGDWKLDRLMP